VSEACGGTIGRIERNDPNMTHSCELLPRAPSKGYDRRESACKAMKPRLLLYAALLGFLLSVPGHAQVYKWVDARGVTNYSSEPPADARAKTKVKVVEDTLSVYTPPRAVTQAIEIARVQRADPLAAKVENLERQLEIERSVRQAAATAAAATQAAAAEAAASRGFEGTWYPAGAFVPHGRPRILPQAQLKPGTTAGNVVGPSGYIPGNSAGALPYTPTARAGRPGVMEPRDRAAPSTHRR